MFTSVWTRLADVLVLLSVVPGSSSGDGAGCVQGYSLWLRCTTHARVDCFRFLALSLSYRPRYTHALRQVSLRYDVTHVLNGTQFSLLLLAY